MQVAYAGMPLPESVQSALKDAKIAADQLAVSVVSLDNRQTVLQWQDQKTVLPASSIKIVTTLAALETLGPAFQWETGFYYDGTIKNGILNGQLYFVGGGDPRYVAEHLWRDVQTLKAHGIRQIHGDIIIDRSLFAEGAQTSFDGQSHRPYNLGADAALINFNSVVIRFIPDDTKGVAHLFALPLQKGLQLPKTIPLASGWCSGWRTQLKANVNDPLRPTFKGTFVKGCGERSFTYVVKDRDAFLKRTFAAQLQEVGVLWKGTVRSAQKPKNVKPLFVSHSDDLATIVRLTNKYSNNILARHLFLSLALPQKTSSIDYSDARAVIGQWLQNRVGLDAKDVYVDNGSGLSRESTVTAKAMTDVLDYGYRSPYAHEWIASFPIAGVDGTMKARSLKKGSAHIKTGLISGAKTIAGIVQTHSGQRMAIFASLQGQNVANGNAVLDALIEWTASQ